MFEVRLSTRHETLVYGRYATREAAERQADAHRGTGYYVVSVVAV